LAKRPQLVVAADGTMQYDKVEEIENLVTWHYEINSFTPCSKEEDGKFYSIVSDYLGTPTHAFDENGKKVWERQIDCYGRLRSGDNKFVPFLYPGQYVDGETGLAYNRFRYYDVESGSYISQDPIGLVASNPNIYAYVADSNVFVDEFGLDGGIGVWGEKVAAKFLEKQGHQILGSVQNASGHGFDLVTKTSNGDIHIIEVKTSNMKPAGKSNMPQWTNNNISKISGNTNGRWGNKPEYQANLLRTIRDAQSKGKLKNDLVQINISKRSIKVSYK
jgi:RHS repeat-associated protein